MKEKTVNIFIRILALIFILTHKLRVALRKFFTPVKRMPLPPLSRIPFLSKFFSSIRIPRFIHALSPVKKNLLVFFAVAVVLLGSVVLYFYFPGLGSDNNSNSEKIDTIGAVKKAKLVATARLGETVSMGNLEITLYNTKEGSYTTFERDTDNNRSSKAFFGANVKVFNTGQGPGLENNETVYALLEDEQGNVYERDPSIEFFVGNIKDYGPDKNVWPRTIREGYFLFPGPAKESKTLKLFIYSDARKEKVVFDLVR